MTPARWDALVIIASDVARTLYSGFSTAVRNDQGEHEFAPNLDGFGAYLFGRYIKAKGLQREDREITTALTNTTGAFPILVLPNTLGLAR